MSEAPDKPDDRPSVQPQPLEVESVELREVPEDELKEILEAHETWVQSRGKKGKQADLRDTNLEKADLSRANLESAMLQRAYLAYGNLQGANLGGANLEGAYLFRANLQEAYLLAADLRRAILEEAVLVRANLEGANLEGANLEGAYIFLANLDRAILTGANFLYLKGLTQKQLDDACGDAKTKLPPNLSVKPCPKESK